MKISRIHCPSLWVFLSCAACLWSQRAAAQSGERSLGGDESLLGEFVVTGNATGGEVPLPKIAVLPSLSPDLEDVTVRAVVRRDLELSGMFRVIADKDAPSGLYGFDDPVDIDAWKALGAESIVKVAARRHAETNRVEVLGLAYFASVGADPVYSKKLVVPLKDLRVTAHRITDALLGALTGRNGAFASELVFAARDDRNRRIYRMDADGYDVKPLSERGHTSMVPAWGAERSVYFLDSENHAPFSLKQWLPSPGAAVGVGSLRAVTLPFGRNSLYSVAIDPSRTRMAVAVADAAGSSIWVGGVDGSNMKKVSNTAIATSPAFGPKGQLAWIGGDSVKNGGQRVYLDGKIVSPQGFTAAAPTFCDTEDGVRLVYSVRVTSERQDLVMSDTKGGQMQRLTKGQGTNQHPACSPDGRLIAFSSNRNKSNGIYFMTIKRWRAVKLDDLFGEQLRWQALPPPPPDQAAGLGQISAGLSHP